MSRYGGASSSAGAAPLTDIEMSMCAADSMQGTTKRKASEEPTADETTAMLAAVAWEREQEDKPLRLDEDQEVLEYDVEDDGDCVQANEAVSKKAGYDAEDCAELEFERVDDDDYSTAASGETAATAVMTALLACSRGALSGSRHTSTTRCIG